MLIEIKRRRQYRMHDVIVVGGGVGGVGAAALLAKQGRKVLLLEKNPKVGGKCVSHKKEGFHFPVFVHAFGRGSIGSCSNIARMLGEEIAWTTINEVPVCVNGEWMGITVKGRPIGVKLPLKDVLSLAMLALQTLPKLLTKKGQDELDRTDLRSWLQRRTDNPKLHAIIGYLAGAFYCIPYWEASLGETIQIFRGLMKGKIAYPVGECESIPETLFAGFKKYDGEFKQDNVKRIVVSEGKVQGVELSDGKLLEAPMVISNAGIRRTVLDLVGEEHFDEDYVNYVRNLRPSWSALVVHVALSKKITDRPGGLYAKSLDVAGYTEQLERGEIPQKPYMWCMVTTNWVSSFAPPGKQIICFGCPMPFREGADWEKWADRVLESGEELFPGLNEHIIFREVIPPDYIQSWADKEGVLLEVAQTTQQVGANRPSMISPINGLYYVGVDVANSGKTRGVGVDAAGESALECAEIAANRLGPAG
jgi:phytoene dehydrogenase-like protein